MFAIKIPIIILRSGREAEKIGGKRAVSYENNDLSSFSNNLSSYSDEHTASRSNYSAK